MYSPSWHLPFPFVHRRPESYQQWRFSSPILKSPPPQHPLKTLCCLGSGIPSFLLCDRAYLQPFLHSTSGKLVVLFGSICRSIKGALENSTSGNVSGSELAKLLSDCIGNFSGNVKYKNDVRFLKIWFLSVRNYLSLTVIFCGFNLSSLLHTCGWLDNLYVSMCYVLDEVSFEICLCYLFPYTSLSFSYDAHFRLFV